MGSVREAQKRETEARVLTVADELFRTRGFTVTTIRDIATAAGVSTGTVMSAGDKNALLVASFDQRIEEIHQGRAECRAESASGAIEQIAELVEPFAELFTADPQLARVYGSILVAGETASSTFTELADTLINEVEAVLVRAQVQVARPLAESIYFAYIGRLFTWTPQDDHNTEQLKRSLKGIIAAICQTRKSQA
ncbi:TetR/AcrR family transcriptional regulator [Glutamicibacter sp. NPDC087344]|uniref:TetR/AcrR family transcriptional regulator n=1 Tax=Glutamicibacter sp. NPDC087344 TaxID=3363994 RepID=UPI0038178394